MLSSSPAPRHAPAATRWPVLVADAGAWALGLVLATLLVSELEVAAVRPGPLAVLVAVAVALHVGACAARGAYRGTHRSGRDDVVAGAVLVGAVVAVLLMARLAVPGVPLAAVLVAGPLVLVLTGAAREAVSRADLRRLRPTAGAARTVVVGAGDGGAELVRLMLRTPDSPYLPVALVDDDAGKRSPVHGVPVHGGREDLAAVVTSTAATVVVVAVAQAQRALLADVTARVAHLGVEVSVLPSLSELLVRPLEIADVRPVSPADLLGRQETHLDSAAIAGYLAGRRVLVTGAGGSIGSELCRQVAGFAPARLVMLDRDESALHAVQLSLSGRALLDQRDLVVADVRDAARLDAVFAEHHPEVVFHAAALKHLPLLEMHPGEALRTNVEGTANVLRACSAWGTGRVVNVSTDKAADPCSVLGYSKRVAERLTAWWAREEGLSALSVRFGNVLGSRGSMLTTFAEQIRRGGPLTVTDPAVTRYFMTVEEAVGLVVQAGAIGRAGEALVLDMGEPVSILEVVRRLMDDAGAPDLEVQFTGLRPGEKLHEVLLAAAEVDRRPVHPMVSHVDVPPLDPAALDGLVATMPDGDVVRGLRRLCAVPADVPVAPPAASADRPVVPAALVLPADRVSA